MGLVVGADHRRGAPRGAGVGGDAAGGLADQPTRCPPAWPADIAQQTVTGTIVAEREAAIALACCRQSGEDPKVRSAALPAVLVGLWSWSCMSDGSEGASATATTTTGSSTSTSTSTGMTSSSSSGYESSGCGFLCTPDGGAGGAGCDVWKQDCPEGQKCNAWATDGGAWNSHKCVPVVPDPDAVGDPCSVEGSGVSGIDSCAKGAMCWNVDPKTDMGVCVALCQGDERQCASDPWSCCAAGSSCTISAGGILILCFPNCDPLIQDCFGPKEVCYPVGDGFQCAPDISGDMGAAGDPCEFINTCDPGTYCGVPTSYPGCDPNAAGCCIPFCSLEAPDCVMGTECMPWYDPMDPPYGFEDLGACLIP